jgi:hypothetical protein
MVDLSTEYLGMKLKNPVIAGSSGLTNSVKSVKELEENGAGAVVLKSIFEEEIAFEYEDIMNEAESKGYNLDQFDYYDYKIKEDNLDKYTTLISESKKKCFHSYYRERQLCIFPRMARLCISAGEGRCGCSGAEYVFPAL